MKEVRRSQWLAVFIVLSLLAIPSVAADEFDLIAGQNDIVGTITVWQDSTNLYVKYMINTDEWRITQTQLEVGTSLADIPTNKAGNPKIGEFTYSTIHDYVTEYTYTIPLADIGGGDEFIIAAHAVVAEKDAMQMLEVLENKLALPQCVKFSTVQQPAANGLSYFLTRIYPDSSLADDYPGWCAQNTVYIGRETHNATVYSSYDPLLYSTAWPEGYSLPKFTQENFCYVNWIINQHYVGKSAPAEVGGKFTYGDVQMALWYFISEYPPTTFSNPPHNNARVQYIIESAELDGEGFIPDDITQNIALVLIPVEYCGGPVKEVQLTMIEYGMSGVMEFEDLFGEEETAWAAGTSFPGGSWATYFTYYPSIAG